MTPLASETSTGLSDLLPCPFCGSDRVDSYFVRDGRRVECVCGASLVRFHGKDPDTDAVVRAAWNRRALIAESATAVPVNGPSSPREAK